MVTDLDLADYIALVPDTACQTQELLDSVEDVTLGVGLHMNAKKTQCMVLNHQDDVTIKISLFEIVLDYLLRSAINGREEHRRFTINPRRSGRVGPLMVTDLDLMI